MTLVALSLSAATAGKAFPQVAAGAITGVVRDQAGQTVPGAAVTVTNLDAGPEFWRSVEARGEGAFYPPVVIPDIA